MGSTAIGATASCAWRPFVTTAGPATNRLIQPQAGMVLTKPLDWPGGLQLCADAAGGSVKVSVLDGAGQVVAQSVAVTGDVTDQQVIFSSSRQLESLTGQLVRLKFELDKAKLYSFALTW